MKEEGTDDGGERIKQEERRDIMEKGRQEEDRGAERLWLKTSSIQQTIKTRKMQKEESEESKE